MKYIPEMPKNKKVLILSITASVLVALVAFFVFFNSEFVEEKVELANLFAETQAEVD